MALRIFNDILEFNSIFIYLCAYEKIWARSSTLISMSSVASWILLN